MICKIVQKGSDTEINSKTCSLLKILIGSARFGTWPIKMQSTFNYQPMDHLLAISSYILGNWYISPINNIYPI